jgi:ABC-2 type transport system permease protein
VNTTPNAVSGSDLGSEAVAARVSPTSPLVWSLRRELWENRSIYVAPLAVAVLFLAGFAISTVRLPDKMRAAAALDPMPQRAALSAPYDMASGLMMIVALIVGVFYSLDALYGERRDRSTLFWKSLPVSDLTTVLAKAAVPILVLQLVAFVLTVAMQLIMLLLSSAVLAASGQGVGALWSALSPFRMWLLLLYHLLAVHSLSHAPIYAWMLLVSAWASRAPLLWAVLPPIAFGFFEKVVFGSTHFLALVGDLVSGGSAAMAMPGTFPTHPMTHLTPGLLLISPGLWAGLVLTAVFLVGAARLRRSAGPI